MEGNRPHVMEGSIPERSIDTDKYPYCVPSYNPAVLNGSLIEAWLDNQAFFGQTHCDVYEITDGQGIWQTKTNDASLRHYLQVILNSPTLEPVFG